MSRYISADICIEVKNADDPYCAYCQTSVYNTGQPLTYDHIVPSTKGGNNSFENLCRACRQFNEFKGNTTHAPDPLTGNIVHLFHPRQQIWAEHFMWDTEGIRLIGSTTVGRATIVALNMNNEAITSARQRWVAVGWHPPKVAN